QQSQALAVEEKEQFIFLNGATQRASPLISDVEGARFPKGMVDPVVGIEHAAIPIVPRVSVQLIAPGLGQVVHRSTGSAAKLAGVAGADDGRFLNLVLTQDKAQCSDERSVGEVVV